MNADGRGDLILGDAGPGNSADWWNGSPPGISYWLPGRPERSSGDVDISALGVPAERAMAAGDLDGDGIQDLLLLDGEQRPYLFYGAPDLFVGGVDLTKAAATFDAYAWPNAIVRANDLDGDGDDEIVLAETVEIDSFSPQEIALLSGTSARINGPVGAREVGKPFADPARLLEGVFPVGDLDADGMGDLVTRSGEYFENPSTIPEERRPDPRARFHSPERDRLDSHPLREARQRGALTAVAGSSGHGVAAASAFRGSRSAPARAFA